MVTSRVPTNTSRLSILFPVTGIMRGREPDGLDPLSGALSLSSETVVTLKPF